MAFVVRFLSQRDAKRARALALARTDTAVDRDDVSDEGYTDPDLKGGGAKLQAELVSVERV